MTIKIRLVPKTPAPAPKAGEGSRSDSPRPLSPEAEALLALHKLSSIRSS